MIRHKVCLPMYHRVLQSNANRSGDLFYLHSIVPVIDGGIMLKKFRTMTLHSRSFINTNMHKRHGVGGELKIKPWYASWLMLPLISPQRFAPPLPSFSREGLGLHFLGSPCEWPCVGGFVCFVFFILFVSFMFSFAFPEWTSPRSCLPSNCYILWHILPNPACPFSPWLSAEILIFRMAYWLVYVLAHLDCKSSEDSSSALCLPWRVVRMAPKINLRNWDPTLLQCGC